MPPRYHHTSLTRISPLHRVAFDVEVLPRDQWRTGDYVVGAVARPPGALRHIELTSGRMVEVDQGDLVLGALGRRYATMEATGTWEKVGADGTMHLLTSAGLLGLKTSTSPFIGMLIDVTYRGHVQLAGRKATMRRFVHAVPDRPFTIPTVLLVGTSMSAGKTTVARVIIRLLKEAGMTVVGAKLTGAGRYRDILAMQDAGADHIMDFVDVGLPSTVHPEADYRTALRALLSMMAATGDDVAVVEIGASPLEPYNGAAAIEMIRDSVRCRVLCASDPYAAYGVMKAFGIRPDVVSGVATNTLAGIALIERLCHVPALNVLRHEVRPALLDVLLRALNPECGPSNLAAPTGITKG